MHSGLDKPALTQIGLVAKITRQFGGVLRLGNGASQLIAETEIRSVSDRRETITEFIIFPQVISEVQAAIEARDRTAPWQSIALLLLYGVIGVGQIPFQDKGGSDGNGPKVKAHALAVPADPIAHADPHIIDEFEAEEIHIGPIGGRT